MTTSPGTDGAVLRMPIREPADERAKVVAMLVEVEMRAGDELDVGAGVLPRATCERLEGMST